MGGMTGELSAKTFLFCPPTFLGGSDREAAEGGAIVTCLVRMTGPGRRNAPYNDFLAAETVSRGDAGARRSIAGLIFMRL